MRLLYYSSAISEGAGARHLVAVSKLVRNAMGAFNPDLELEQSGAQIVYLISTTI